MIKISATQLEGYRRFIDGKLSAEQFRTQLLRLEPPTPIMAIGTAFHELLQCGFITPEQCDPYFLETDIIAAREKIDYRCPAFEYKLRKQYETFDGTPVIVTGVADQITPFDVVEFKTRFTPYQYEGYADSMQWRVYCELFEVPAVTYKVWELKRDEELNACWVKSYNEFAMFKGANNLSVVREAITGLVEVLKAFQIDNNPLFQMGI